MRTPPTEEPSTQAEGHTLKVHSHPEGGVFVYCSCMPKTWDYPNNPSVRAETVATADLLIHGPNPNTWNAGV